LLQIRHARMTTIHMLALIAGRFIASTPSDRFCYSRAIAA
jgi:hypothetical protein